MFYSLGTDRSEMIPSQIPIHLLHVGFTCYWPGTDKLCASLSAILSTITTGAHDQTLYACTGHMWLSTEQWKLFFLKHLVPYLVPKEKWAITKYRKLQQINNTWTEYAHPSYCTYFVLGPILGQIIISLTIYVHGELIL